MARIVESMLGLGVEPNPHIFDMYYPLIPIDAIKNEWPDAMWICDLSVESYDPVKEDYRWSARPVSWWKVRDKQTKLADLNKNLHMYVGLYTPDTSADAEAHWRAVHTSDEAVFDVNALLNRRTGEIIWSRFDHDCVFSKTDRNVFIDGGKGKPRWSTGFAKDDWLKVNYNVLIGTFAERDW